MTQFKNNDYYAVLKKSTGNEIIAIIAYGLFKIDELTYINNLNRNPSNEELIKLFEHASTEAALQMYITEAHRYIENIAEIIVNDVMFTHPPTKESEINKEIKLAIRKHFE